MNLEGKTLDEWLVTCSENMFPGGGLTNYYRRYRQIQEYLDRNVHPYVNALAMRRDGGYLTDHGPEHIKTVIQRASRLADSPGCILTAYEVYVLLVGIQIHDVGNIFGREEHELQSETIMDQLSLLLGDDTGEKHAIYKIAAAHSGYSNGNKDKISKLLETNSLLGHDIRPRLLAALLRFADELADDRTRAARFLMDSGGVPTESEIHHHYACALCSVKTEMPGDSVVLHFELTLQGACATFGKGAEEVYLLDEIFERTLKMHRERIYCTRFLRPSITIDKINVTIRVYGPRYSGDPRIITYRLEESGYPEIVSTIHAICPELTDASYGGVIDGKSLHALLSQGGSQ